MNMKNIKTLIVALLCIPMLDSCNYLDIIPDNVATVESLFTDKNSAKKYLYTCYSFMPSHRNIGDNPGFSFGGEFVVNQNSWIFTPSDNPRVLFETGNNSTSPRIDYWSRTKNMFAAIRVCNYFLENVETIPDLPETEKNRWRDEVTFLKAYYHWWLFQMYGPIPISDKNLGFTEDEDLMVYRNTKDECAEYIVGLLDKAINGGGLPDNIVGSEVEELGRITKAIAMSVKAKVLVTLASDFFNGNRDYEKMVDNRGIQLFSPNYDKQRWIDAAKACKEAIDFCHEQGMELYKFKAPAGTKTNEQIDYTLQPAMILAGKLPLNNEIIWSQAEGIQGIYGDMQHRYGFPEYIYKGSISNPTEKFVGYEMCGSLGVSLDFAEVFYTNHGVPITEDKDYFSKQEWYSADENYMEREDHKYLIKQGYQTNNINLYREPRYYGSIGFRGSLMFGYGNMNMEDMYYFYPKNTNRANSTGMIAKKWVPYTSTVLTGNIDFYHWPIMRLADLYLLYAEALNECAEDGAAPDSEVYRHINMVRERSGLPTVEEAWSKYSEYPTKYQTKEGMRQIIRQERRIELAFEGHSWFDLRRWKMMESLFGASNMRGYNVKYTDNLEYITSPTVIHPTRYESKSNLWPIRNSELNKNLNLVQNLGWE